MKPTKNQEALLRFCWSVARSPFSIADAGINRQVRNRCLELGWLMLTQNSGGDYVYLATDAGRDAVLSKVA